MPYLDLAQIDGKEVEDLFSGVLSPTEHHQNTSSTTPIPPAAAAPTPAATQGPGGDGMMGPPPTPIPSLGQVMPQRRPAPTSLPLQLSGSQSQVNMPVPQSPQPRTPQDIGR